MKDPNDCSWPHERLCAHDCKMGCRKRAGKPLRTADDLEEEAWKELEKKLHSCDHLGLCQSRPGCPTCKP